MNFQSFLPAGVLAEDALVLMAAIAAMLCTFAVWQALVIRDPVKASLKRLQERRTRLHGDLIDQRRKRRSTIAESAQVTSLLKRLDLLRSREAEKAALRLAQAGLRSREALITFQFAKLTLPFVVGIVGFVMINWLQLWNIPENLRLPASMLAAVLGWAAPEVIVKNIADKRRQAMQRGLPDAIDLMVICAEAGLSLDATLSRVAREIAPSAPELADEVGLAAVELTFLPERPQALINLTQRTNMAAIRALVNTLKQTERYGTPLAQSLRVLAAEFRDQRMMRAEEKAARLPAILTVPMIVFMLPPLFIILLGPAILRAIDAFSGLGR
jgi:tight adherence protein C